MRKLNTIQKRNNLNTVYAVDEKGIGNANHVYNVIVTDGQGNETPYSIAFQNGPRKEWMNKRVEDRAERGVLGTSNK